MWTPLFSFFGSLTYHTLLENGWPEKNKILTFLACRPTKNMCYLFCNNIYLNPSSQLLFFFSFWLMISVPIYLTEWLIQRIPFGSVCDQFCDTLGVCSVLCGWVLWCGYNSFGVHVECATVWCLRCQRCLQLMTYFFSKFQKKLFIPF